MLANQQQANAMLTNQQQTNSMLTNQQQTNSMLTNQQQIHSMLTNQQQTNSLLTNQQSVTSVHLTNGQQVNMQIVNSQQVNAIGGGMRVPQATVSPVANQQAMVNGNANTPRQQILSPTVGTNSNAGEYWFILLPLATHPRFVPIFS